MELEQFGEFVNSGDDKLTFTCQQNQALVGIFAVYDFTQKDRQFKMKCANLLSEGMKSQNRKTMLRPTVSEWSAYSAYDEPIDYTCDHKGVIMGIFSDFSIHSKDRKFKFKCGTGIPKLMSPFSSGWVNEYTHVLDFECPRGQVLTNIASEHAGTLDGVIVDDRRWKFKCATLEGVVYNAALSQGWSDWTGKWTTAWDYQCANGGIVAGLHAEYSPDAWDRIYKASP